MSRNTKIFTLFASLVLSIIVAIPITIEAGIASAASLNADQIQSAIIADSLHAVVQAAKKYQEQTGQEATSIDQLLKADVLKKPVQNTEISANDPWQSWGDGTGALVMWNTQVSPEICKILDPGGALPTDPPGKADPNKGFQCMYAKDNGYYIIEPVYIHDKPQLPPK